MGPASLLLAAATMAAVFALAWGLARAWPGALRARVLVAPLMTALVVLVALDRHPPPALDERARSLAAAHAEPYRLLESPPGLAISLVAWPAAWAWGPARALAMVIAVAAGLQVLLLVPLSAAAGLPSRSGIAAQLLGLAMPLFWWPLAEGDAAAATAGAGELLLLVHLARRLPHLQGARDAAALCAFAILPQLVSPAAVGDVLLLAGFCALIDAAAGERGRPLRLMGAVLVASALVVGGFLGLRLFGAPAPLLLEASNLPPLRTLLLLGPLPLLLILPGLQRLGPTAARLPLVAAFVAAGVLLLRGSLAPGSSPPFAAVLAAVTAVAVTGAWPKSQALRLLATAALVAWAAWSLARPWP